VSKLDAALNLAGKGLHVFPCEPNQKRPATQHGFLDATTDPAQIRAWWGQNPDYNPAIATGPSGLLVVDLDVKDPKRDGVAHFMALWYQHTGDLPDWNKLDYVDTPSGGRHVYFRGKTGCSQSRVGPGIDIRSEGGYVLAPGATLDGVPYVSYLKAEKSFLPAPAPLRGVPVAEARPEAVVPEVAKSASHHEAVRFLRHCTPPLEGQRDAATFAAVARLKGLGIVGDEARELIMEHFAVRGDYLEVDRIVDAKLASAARGNTTNGEGSELPEIAKLFRADAPPATGTEKPTNPFMAAMVVNDEVDGDVEDVEYLVDKVVPKVGIGFMYAPSGSFKTYATIDIIKSMLAGGTWAGKFAIPHPANVVYIAGEGQLGVQLRLKAWSQAFKERERKGNFAFIKLMPNMTSPDQMEQLAEALKSLDWKPEFIVFDTMFRALAGSNANDQSEMSNVIATMDAMKNGYKCCVMGVAHTNKTNQGDIFGSTVFRASSDFMLKVERLKEEGAPAAFKLIVDKSKDDGEPAPVIMVGRTFEVTYQAGKTRPQLVFDPKPEAAPQRILDAATGGPVEPEQPKAQRELTMKGQIEQYLLDILDGKPQGTEMGTTAIRAKMLQSGDEGLAQLSGSNLLKNNVKELGDLMMARGMATKVDGAWKFHPRRE